VPRRRLCYGALLQRIVIESGQADRGANQQGTIFRGAIPVSPQQRHLVGAQRLGSGTCFLLAGEQVGGARRKRPGDSCQVTSDLTCTACFPLGNGTSRDPYGTCQLVLGEALGEAAGADACGEFGGMGVGHANLIGEGA